MTIYHQVIRVKAVHLQLVKMSLILHVFYLNYIAIAFVSSPSHNDKLVTLDSNLTTISTTDPSSLCKIYRRENGKLREELESCQKEVVELRNKLKDTIEENEKATDMLYTELENYRVYIALFYCFLIEKSC